ncbi:hypothetical protein LEP1GSC195_2041 [Leptospira wolbachii serovar Codice str. CDC]|uniref:Uncharacterized protein n=1 Tax=Leptospira wolbachii serovar Codice str. CDC TaxID=1218599 RepID=R9A171_9LEPT|nr:hypothetical protein LEP1GSC195_2041 [Leptospira wolbachii serovar Codice str. CDC]
MGFVNRTVTCLGCLTNPLGVKNSIVAGRVWESSERTKNKERRRKRKSRRFANIRELENREAAWKEKKENQGY